MQKILSVIGLVLSLIGTGIVGFSIPKKGGKIVAPRRERFLSGIVAICLGTCLQILGVLIP